MNYTLLSLFLLSSCVLVGQAKTPATQVQTLRPTTIAPSLHPSTNTQAYHPKTTAEVVHPASQVAVIRPQTNVRVQHPSTQVNVIHPQTTVEVIHPQTSVQVVHPQTNVTVFHPQTPFNDTKEIGGRTSGSSFSNTKGKRGASSQVTTSMSDFQPKQAKNFSAPVPEKAAPLGGGSNSLGNDTNQAEKDNANKSSLLGKQKETQSLEIDPKQTKLQGLDQKVAEKAKEALSKKK